MYSASLSRQFSVVFIKKLHGHLKFKEYKITEITDSLICNPIFKDHIQRKEFCLYVTEDTHWNLTIFNNQAL